jgi:nicotinamide-nucleotide amidase
MALRPARAAGQDDAGVAVSAAPVAPSERALAERLQGICLGRGLTLALAESCTGGLIAAAITEIPGSSGYFLGSVVSYSDAAKSGLLDVPEAALAAHGAVSAQVAKAMAAGARARFGAALAGSVTGIAGPEGGSEAKPVGLAYIGIDDGSAVEVRRFIFDGDRTAIRGAAARATLEWLIERAETAAPPSR